MTDQRTNPRDPGLLVDLYKQFHTLYQQHLEDFGRQADRAFDLNKHFSSFYERLLLIDLGTLGLSVTALIGFIPKISAISFPRQSFLWLLVPAWLLLLFSVILCRIAMSWLIISNNGIYRQLDKLTHRYRYQQIGVTTQRISRTLSGQDSAMAFSALADEIEEFLKKDQIETLDQIVAPALEAQPVQRFCSRWAVVSLEIALILLCIFAIKLFLAV